MNWTIASGPTERDQVEGYDTGRAWDYSIARGDEERAVTIIVADSISERPAPESLEAITTHGRSALRTLLMQEDPARCVVITTSGLREDPASAD